MAYASLLPMLSYDHYLPNVFRRAPVSPNIIIIGADISGLVVATGLARQGSFKEEPSESYEGVDFKWLANSGRG
jgi:hypothetical protein